MDQELVSSSYILSEKGILLIKHRKLKKWVPPGGHVEKKELPHEAAIREAREETGLNIELISLNPLQMDYPNAKTLPVAYLTLRHPVIFPFEHVHINFVYLAKPVSGLLQKNEESSEIKWFTKEEVLKLDKEDIYQETINVIHHLFEETSFFETLLGEPLGE